MVHSVLAAALTQGREIADAVRSCNSAGLVISI